MNTYEAISKQTNVKEADIVKYYLPGRSFAISAHLFPCKR